MIKPFVCETLSWEDMYEYSRVLAGKMREDKFRPDVIVAIARGGYVPARNLCDFMMVNELFSFKVEHWGTTGKKDATAQLKQPLKADVKGKNVLVVDDISHTGQSLQIAVDHVLALKPKQLKTATLFVIEGSKFTPNYYASKKPWKWFIFPWNFTEDLCNLVSGLFEAKTEDRKSLDMVQEELESKHGIDVPKLKLKHIMRELVIRRTLQPYWVSGNLMRWMPYPKKKGGALLR